MIYIVLGYFLSVLFCVWFAKDAEKVVYGEDTPNEVFERVVYLIALVPVVNTIVGLILVHSYLKSKFNSLEGGYE